MQRFFLNKLFLFLKKSFLIIFFYFFSIVFLKETKENNSCWKHKKLLNFHTKVSNNFLNYPSHLIILFISHFFNILPIQKNRNNKFPKDSNNKKRKNKLNRTERIFNRKQ